MPTSRARLCRSTPGDGRRRSPGASSTKARIIPAQSNRPASTDAALFSHPSRPSRAHAGYGRRPRPDRRAKLPGRQSHPQRPPTKGLAPSPSPPHHKKTARKLDPYTSRPLTPSPILPNPLTGRQSLHYADVTFTKTAQNQKRRLLNSLIHTPYNFLKATRRAPPAESASEPHHLPSNKPFRRLTNALRSPCPLSNVVPIIRPAIRRSLVAANSLRAAHPDDS